MPEISLYALLVPIATMAAGMWVLIDGRRRLASRPPWEPFVWALGTAVPYTLPIFLPMYLLGARAPGRSGQWGLGEMIGIAIFFGLTLPLAAGLMGLHETRLTLREISLVILVQDAGFVLLSVLGVAVRYGLPLARLGLTTRRWAAMCIFGLIVGAAMIPVASATEKAGVEVYALVRGRQAAELQAEREHRMDPLYGILATTKGPAATAWLMALLGVAVPIGEEVYFRGVVYGGLRDRYGIGWGLLASTLFFGVVHRQVVHFLPIAVLGLALALLYQRTRSLVPSITVHAVNNIVSILARIYGWEI